jgi:hypothetical protein
MESAPFSGHHRSQHRFSISSTFSDSDLEDLDNEDFGIKIRRKSHNAGTKKKKDSFAERSIRKVASFHIGNVKSDESDKMAIALLSDKIGP